MNDLIIASEKQQKLRARFTRDVAKCAKNYFADGGAGLKKIDLNVHMQEGLKMGAIAYAGENFELAGHLLNSSPVYVKIFISCRKKKSEVKK